MITNFWFYGWVLDKACEVSKIVNEIVDTDTTNEINIRYKCVATSRISIILK